MKKFQEARPGLMSEASDNQGYPGLAWEAFALEKGSVDCQLVIDYLKAKMQELANEEASAAQAAGGSTPARSAPDMRRGAFLHKAACAGWPVYVVQGAIAHFARV